MFRNGKEKVDLDLIVLDHLPECECNMYKRGDKQCSCTHSYTGYVLYYVCTSTKYYHILVPIITVQLCVHCKVG